VALVVTRVCGHSPPSHPLRSGPIGRRRTGLTQSAGMRRTRASRVVAVLATAAGLIALALIAQSNQGEVNIRRATAPSPHSATPVGRRTRCRTTSSDTPPTAP